jgi:hydrocephalus-inducing protein
MFNLHLYSHCCNSLKTPKKVFKTLVTADFINPLLEASNPCLSFSYTWSEENPVRQDTQPLTLRNVSLLPLDFVLRTSLPFSLSGYEFHLEPAESATLEVYFDPGMHIGL